MEDLRRQLREKFPGAHGMGPNAGQKKASGKLFQPISFPAGAIAEVTLRNRPEDWQTPCAILTPSSGKVPKEKLPLLSNNPAARIAGIEASWPLNRALVRCPSLRVISSNPDAEASLREELISLGESLTPDLELTAADVVIGDWRRKYNRVRPHRSLGMLTPAEFAAKCVGQVVGRPRCGASGSNELTEPIPAATSSARPHQEQRGNLNREFIQDR